MPRSGFLKCALAIGLLCIIVFSCNRLTGTRNDAVKATNSERDEAGPPAEQATDQKPVNTTQLEKSRLPAEPTDQKKDFGTGSQIKQLLTLKGHSDDIKSLGFDGDSTRLMSVSNKIERGHAIIWNLTTGKEFLTIDGKEDEYFESAAFTPDGKLFGLSTFGLLDGRPDWPVRICESERGSEEFTIRGRLGRLTSFVFSPDSTRIALANDGSHNVGPSESEISIWDLKSHKNTLTIHEPLLGIRWIAFSPDGNRIAGALQRPNKAEDFAKSGTIRIWDSVTGEAIIALSKFNDGVIRLAFSPDGKQIASVSGRYEAKEGKVTKSEVMLWDALRGQPIQSCITRKSMTWSIAFSPDCRYLFATGGENVFGQKGDLKDGWGELSAWDIANGRELFAIRAHSRPITSIAFSRDGRRLATGSQDKTIIIWDVSKLIDATVVQKLETEARKQGLEKEEARNKQKVAEQEEAKKENELKETESSERKALLKLATARTLIEDRKLNKAKEICQEIIEKYPKTKAAEEARQLLEMLENQ